MKWLLAGAAVVMAVTGCSSETAAPAGEASPEARAVVARLMALRFAASEQPVRHDRAPREEVRVLGPAVATGFDEIGDSLVPRLADGAERGVVHPADVRLPRDGDGAFHVEDRTTKVAIDVRMVGNGGRGKGEVLDGYVVYRGERGGGDVVHRVTAEGTEDYVLLERAPAGAELVYEVRLGDGVAGVRVLPETVELLDQSGVPRLRMAPPYLVDAVGGRHEAHVAVEGCAVDADARAPWGRAVTAPGVRSCVVRIAWGQVAYPVILDPAWTSTGSMATARYNHTATLLLSGKVLVAGGSTGDASLASAELYDPVANTWSAAGSLTNARWLHTANGLSNGKVLVAGGIGNGGPCLASAELYDPVANTWSDAGSLVAGRCAHAASVLLNGSVLLTGGGGTGPGGAKLASAELYDAAANAWSAAGSLTTGRSFHATTVLSSGKIVATGGLGSGGPTVYSAELYDPVANTWSAAGNNLSQSWEHTSSLLSNGKLLVVGGGGGLSNAELYDPTSNTWSVTGSMTTERSAHTASVLSNGKVLVAAGRDNNGAYLKSAELYDPAAPTWGATVSMAAARHRHTASVLANGKVLVTGGWNGAPLSSAEIFALVPTGGACSLSGECVSGFCADGFCCNTACDAGPCDACSKAGGSSADGTCTLFTGAPCDDGNACTQADTCQNGVCTGATPVVCSGPDQCHVAGVCDSSNGVCSKPAKADGTACNDGNACTQLDACQSGACVGTKPIVCAAEDQCHVAGTCNPANGVCSNPTKPNGAACDDANVCTQPDSCQSGVCTGANPFNCIAQDECHVAGTCNPANGACSNPAKPDGTACAGGACKGGMCTMQPGTTSSSATTGSGTGGGTTSSSATTSAGAGPTSSSASTGAGTGGAATSSSAMSSTSAAGTTGPGTGTGGGGPVGDKGNFFSCAAAPASPLDARQALLVIGALVMGVGRRRTARRVSVHRPCDPAMTPV